MVSTPRSQFSNSKIATKFSPHKRICQMREGTSCIQQLCIELILFKNKSPVPPIQTAKRPHFQQKIRLKQQPRRNQNHAENSLQMRTQKCYNKGTIAEYSASVCSGGGSEGFSFFTHHSGGGAPKGCVLGSKNQRGNESHVLSPTTNLGPPLRCSRSFDLVLKAIGKDTVHHDQHQC